MSRRVLARPLAAATLAAALVLTPALATADPGNGNGGGQGNGNGQGNGKGLEQAPGQQKDKGGKGQGKDKAGAVQDKGKSDAAQDKGKGGGKDTAPGQVKEQGQPATGQGNAGQGNAGQGSTGQGNAGNGGKGQGNGGSGDPAGNNGTVKIAPLGEMDSIPNNTPHPGCTFQVEWYGFDEGEDVVSTVTFAAQAPTSDVVIGGTAPTQVPVGGDAASGAGTETGLDAVQAYTLTFDGEPHPQQGYHVKLTVSTPHSLGNDTKTKVFWVAPCEDEGTEGTTETGGTEGTQDTDECTEDMTEDTGTTGTTEDECVAGTGTSSSTGTTTPDQGVLGTQLAAATAPVRDLAAVLTSNDRSGRSAAVPTTIDAGAGGGLSALTDSPWPLAALLGGLLAGLAAVVVRRRAGA